MLTQILGFIPALQDVGEFAYKKARGKEVYKVFSTPMVDDFEKVARLLSKKEPSAEDIFLAIALLQEPFTSVPAGQVVRTYKKTQPKEQKGKSLSQRSKQWQKR